MEKDNIIRVLLGYCGGLWGTILTLYLLYRLYKIFKKAISE